MVDPSCLNPCFTGCPFQGCCHSLSDLLIKVLILVLLDALFRDNRQDFNKIYRKVLILVLLDALFRATLK